MDNEYILRSIIDKNLSYKDRRTVIETMSDSIVVKESVYSNIGNYFYKKFHKLKLKTHLKAYCDSKGDFTKLKGHKTVMMALNTLSHDAHLDVSKMSKIVEAAALNLESRKAAFTTAFKAKGASLSRFMYAVVAKSVVIATSYLVSESSIIPYNRGKHEPANHFAFKALELFNTCCKNGTVDKMIRSDVNLGNRIVHENIVGDMIDIGVSVASALITGIRSMVYWVYYTRIDLADYLEQQAAYLEINKIALENRKDLNEAKKKEIIAAQTKWQERLLSLSDMIQVDEIKAARQAQNQADKDAKDMKAEDATGKGDTDDGNDVPDFF